MTIADRWLLPDGVEELLPAQASQVEALRRKLLDLYRSWGYELVIPPLVEFTDSLLVGLDHDVNLQTFKVTDQLSGRTMGIRADITPQTARMDAHSLKRKGPCRLCYADSVLHTKPKALLASRSPIQLGAEFYGDSGLGSDIEVISLMLETLMCAGLDNITLDLGHVGIYRALVEQAGLTPQAEQTLSDALQRKSTVDIEAAITDSVSDPSVAQMMRALSQLNGDRSVLSKAKEVLANAPAAVLEAIDTLQQVSNRIASRMPDINIYFDLTELRGYHYHTGLVFSALAPGHGQAVANGGRYDDIGEVFGRARPATGFTTDLKALLKYLPLDQQQAPPFIFAPSSEGLNEAEDKRLWSAIGQLRAAGELVVSAVSADCQPPPASRSLVLKNGEWSVV